MADVSKVRQNFHKESEAGINKQINLGKSNSQHLPHFDLIHSLFSLYFSQNCTLRTSTSSW